MSEAFAAHAGLRAWRKRWWLTLTPFANSRCPAVSGRGVLVVLVRRIAVGTFSGTEESPHLENSSDFDRLRRGINNAHGL